MDGTTVVEVEVPMSEEDRRGLSLEVLAERVAGLEKSLTKQLNDLMALFAGGTYLREDMYQIRHEALREDVEELKRQRLEDKKNIQDLKRIVFSAVIGPIVVAVVLFMLFRQGV